MNGMTPVEKFAFTALISFDYKNEEITGRGVSTTVDRKICFDSLKAVVTEYKRYGQRYCVVKPANKRRFWKGLRAYCRSRSTSDMSNWAIVFWAGYPLYQIPFSSLEDKSFLFRMSTATVENKNSNNTVTLAHKQLHDIVTKQYRKISQETSSGPSLAHFPAVPKAQDMERTNFMPVNSTHLTAVTYNTSVPQVHEYHIGMVQSRPTNFTNIGSLAFAPQDQHQSGSARAAHAYTTTKVIIEPSLRGLTIEQIGGNIRASSQSLDGFQYRMNDMVPPPMTVHIFSSSSSDPLHARSPTATNNMYNMSDYTATPINPNEALKTVLPLLTKVRDENMNQLSKNEADSVQKELRSSFSRANLKRPSISQGNAATASPKRSTRVDSSSIKESNSSGVPYKKSLQQHHSRHVRWSSVEESFLVGLTMECYLSQGTHDWEKIARCYEIAWSKYSETQAFIQKMAPRSRSSLARHYKYIKEKIRSGSHEYSLDNYFSMWRDDYNKDHRLIQIKD